VIAMNSLSDLAGRLIEPSKGPHGAERGVELELAAAVANVFGSTVACHF
jgi:hypothetical protein